MNSRMSCPAACRYLVSAAETSARPPALANGAVSAVTKQMRNDMRISLAYSYDAHMRRAAVYLTLIALLAVSGTIGWIAADWPQWCTRLGWCTPP